MSLKVLVIGGAGFIGSHMVKTLAAQDAAVTTIDNLSSGHRDAVRAGRFIEADIANRSLLDTLFASERFDAVMHFASHIEVGESVRRPDKYYRNNVVNTLALLDAMIAANISRFIFSSTAAIFGEPQRTPIDEMHPKQPINPYGRSKWMIEQVLEDYDRAYGLRSTCLRYFTAAGADPEGELGERHDPESHLIPLALQAATGRREGIAMFGTDYDTPDGTCIRDYIHVSDLCDAHALALDRLMAGGASAAFNLGNGNGFSVREVLSTAQRVTGVEFAIREEPRRPGDPPRLVADASAARRVLGWRPKFPQLDTIVEHAWAFERTRR